MKNKEKYNDELIEAFVEGNTCVFKKKFILKGHCHNRLACYECDKLTKKWLEEEYKEPIKLSKDEYIILKNIDKKYQWIARDIDDDLYLYQQNGDNFTCINMFNHLFQFVKWEDKESTNIQELLNNCEVIEDE